METRVQQGELRSEAPIGIIDSGVGGLTILKEIQRELPAESLIYIGDTANCPYGSKHPAEIYRLTTILVDSLIARGAKAVVIACNTISVNCIQQLRADYPAIPFIGAAPAIKPAAAMSTRKRIGILSTVATAESSYQAGLIAQFADGCDVLNLGTNELVPLIERADWNGGLSAVFARISEPFKDPEGAGLVLARSHYPIIRAQIEQEMGDGVQVVDSGAAIARQVRRVLERESLLAIGECPTYEFRDTAGSPTFREIIDYLDIRIGVAA